MAAGLAVAAAAVAVAAPLPLVAGVANADGFESCFKNCIAHDESMTDYCNYACGMTCGPNGALHPVNCQLACISQSCRRLRADGKDMEACYGQCYDSCKTEARAGTGAGGVRPAALPDHPFHKMRDAVQPTSEPDPDDVSRQARGSLRP